MLNLKNPISILLVEDNVLNQKLLYFNFKKLGFEIKIVNNGFEAVEVYTKNFYDVILMDIMMPKLDGYQTTERIREIEQTTGNHSFIIGLTSNVYDSDKESCLACGMNDFMSKPFDIDVFTKIISANFT
ncbi:MAG: response regulator [Bacteroidales bacterium]|nr:response regulator [Bacteroidales bacterium]